jgi:serine/threonine-protein kinase
MTLLIFVLAAAAFLSAVTTIRIAIRGRIVVMPNVVGQPVGQAQQILAAQKLRLRVADRIYDQHPVDTIIRQSPAPGEQIKTQENAQVVLSLGPQALPVPQVEGRSLRLARIALLESGLQLGEVSTIFMPGTEPDIVLKQDPPPDTKAAAPRVDLLVAAGTPPVSYVMPSLVGMAQPDAERILSSAGLHAVMKMLISQPGAIKGTVIGQTPTAGQRIAPDITVELGVAD